MEQSNLVPEDNMIDRKLYHLVSLLLVVLAAVPLLAGCTPPDAATAAPTAAAGSGSGDEPTQPPATSTPSTASNVTNYTSLSAGLRDLGISPFPAGSVTYDFMSMRGTKVKCGNEYIAVYEYRHETDADTDMAKIQPDGTVTGATVEWKAVPHFYRSNRVIVIYDGTDEALLTALAQVMGAPFAEGK